MPFHCTTCVGCFQGAILSLSESANYLTSFCYCVTRVRVNFTCLMVIVSGFRRWNFLRFVCHWSASEALLLTRSLSTALTSLIDSFVARRKQVPSPLYPRALLNAFHAHWLTQLSTTWVLRSPSTHRSKKLFRKHALKLLSLEALFINKMHQMSFGGRAPTESAGKLLKHSIESRSHD